MINKKKVGLKTVKNAGTQDPMRCWLPPHTHTHTHTCLSAARRLSLCFNVFFLCCRDTCLSATSRKKGALMADLERFTSHLWLYGGMQGCCFPGARFLPPRPDCCRQVGGLPRAVWLLGMEAPLLCHRNYVSPSLFLFWFPSAAAA